MIVAAPDVPAVNSPAYWDRRFGSGDWESRSGNEQSRLFAEAQVGRIDLPRDFRGTFLDFGCGMGDGFPVYHRQWPQASLIGIDVSAVAIDHCRKAYGEYATFLCGDHTQVPASDVILASNVLEHLENDEEVAKALYAKAKHLYIVVPYRETVVPGHEHVNSYTKDSFETLRPRRATPFACRGWSQVGKSLVRLYARNVGRFLRFQPLRRRKRQILFQFVREAL